VAPMSRDILDYALVTDPTGAAMAAPAGMILAHNRAAPGADGFRFFAVQPSGLWAVCDCGWRPDLGTHYRPAPSLGSGSDA
jgi:hypothetical protein